MENTVSYLAVGHFYFKNMNRVMFFRGRCFCACPLPTFLAPIECELAGLGQLCSDMGGCRPGLQPFVPIWLKTVHFPPANFLNECHCMKSMLLSLLKNGVTEKNTHGAVYHAALLCLVLFSVARHGSGWCVSACFIYALPLHPPISTASESLPFFGTRQVSWLTSNRPSHVTVILCCAFLGWGSISFDHEHLLQFARLPHTGGVAGRVCTGHQSTALG